MATFGAKPHPPNATTFTRLDSWPVFFWGGFMEPNLAYLILNEFQAALKTQQFFSWQKTGENEAGDTMELSLSKLTVG